MNGRELTLWMTLAAIWGGSFLLMRIAAPAFGPVGLVLVRLAIAAIVLLPLLFRGSAIRELRANAGALTIAGFLNSAFPFTLLAYSTLKLPAGVTAVLNSTTPVLAAVIGSIFLHQKLKPAQWLGLALALGGVTVLSTDRFGTTPEGKALAILASLTAACSYAVGAHFTSAKLRHLPPVTTAVGTLLAGTLLVLPGSALTWPREEISVLPWVAAFILGVFCTGIAYLLYFRLIPAIGATRTASVTVVVPVFAVVWGAIFLGEQVTVRISLGTCIVLTGSFLALYFGKPVPAGPGGGAR